MGDSDEVTLETLEEHVAQLLTCKPLSEKDVKNLCEKGSDIYCFFDNFLNVASVQRSVANERGVKKVSAERSSERVI